MFFLLWFSLTAQAGVEQIGLKQYRCLATISSEFGNSFYNLHYYFNDTLRPSPIPQAQSRIFVCNDLNPYNDDVSYPRLDEIEVMRVFSPLDPGFLDQDSNGILDINDDLSARVGNPVEMFETIEEAIGPVDQPDSITGYFHLPLNGECLTTQNSSYNAQALKDVLGLTKTMGLYIGWRFNQFDDRGRPVCESSDMIYVSETNMTQVWFYYKNGKATRPTTSDEIRLNQMFFFYPLNPSAPLQRTGQQNLYSVTNAETVNGCPTGLPITVGRKPFDRRIGCIPQN
jgi:hypothetical protein